MSGCQAAASHLWHLGEAKPATDWEREIDQLMQQQMVTSNYAKRKRLYDRVQQLDRRESAVHFSGNARHAGGGESPRREIFILPCSTPTRCGTQMSSTFAQRPKAWRARCAVNVATQAAARAGRHILAGRAADLPSVEKAASEAWSALIDKYKNLIYSIPVKLGMYQDAADIFQACVRGPAFRAAATAGARARCRSG